jgi:hypothetical protein
MMGTKYTYYKIKHSVDETKECYISSTDNIKRRMNEHEGAYKRSRLLQSKLYTYIRKNGGWDEWKFEILETKLCETAYQRYMRESELIKQHNATLHTYDKGSHAINYEDDRKQICGRCGITLHIRDTSKANLKKHHNTVKCKKSPPPVIVKGSNNTINISYMRGKKPIIIEGDDNTINIHY